MPFKRLEDDFTRSLKLYRKDPIFNFWYMVYGVKYWFIKKYIDIVRFFNKDTRQHHL